MDFLGLEEVVIKKDTKMERIDIQLDIKFYNFPVFLSTKRTIMGIARSTTISR